MVKKSAFILLFFVLSMGLVIAAETGGKGKATDYGTQPWVVDIEELTEKNDTFRTAWTGKNLQMTVMSVKPKGEIGLEKHNMGLVYPRGKG